MISRHMRAWSSCGIALLVACGPRSPYPLPGAWARLPEARTSTGALVAFGLPAPQPADSAYDQQMLCLSHAPCPRLWMEVFVYRTADTTLISDVHAGTDTAGIVVQLHVAFSDRISFDSAFQLYRSVLGKPREVASRDKPYFPFASWRREDLELTLWGPNGRRPAPVTAHLNSRERGYGPPPRPDISWQLRACEEFSYVFCSDIRR